jgi:hypothetical protein
VLSEACRNPLDLTLSVSTPGQAVAVAIADLHRSSPRSPRHLCKHSQPLHARSLDAPHLLTHTATDLTATDHRSPSVSIALPKP